VEPGADQAAAVALVGVTTVAAQIVAPLAAGLVAVNRRGAVMGTLLSGSIGGMLLARTFSGGLGEWLGWRAPYLVAAVLVLLLAIVLAFTLPVTTPPSRQPYPALLAESLRLLRTEPDLRRSCADPASTRRRSSPGSRPSGPAWRFSLPVRPTAWAPRH
jgi:predicted MFS family arabinose efflux permease